MSGQGVTGKRKRGEDHHCARLNAQDVDTMRSLHEVDDLCINCIAKIFNVKYATAWDAIRYQTWRHVR